MFRTYLSLALCVWLSLSAEPVYANNTVHKLLLDAGAEAEKVLRGRHQLTGYVARKALEESIGYTASKRFDALLLEASKIRSNRWADGLTNFTSKSYSRGYVLVLMTESSDVKAAAIPHLTTISNLSKRANIATQRIWRIQPKADLNASIKAGMSDVAKTLDLHLDVSKKETAAIHSDLATELEKITTNLGRLPQAHEFREALFASHRKREGVVEIGGVMLSTRYGLHKAIEDWLSAVAKSPGAKAGIFRSAKSRAVDNFETYLKQATDEVVNEKYTKTQRGRTVLELENLTGSEQPTI